MAILILDSTTKTIKIALSGAAATTNPDYVVSYADNTGSAFTEGSADGALSGTSDVTVVAAPASATRRVVKQISVQNRDTAAVTIIVKYDNNGTQRILARVTLQVNDTWTIDGTFDNSGSLKQTIGNVSLTTVTGTLAVANGGTGKTSWTSNGLVYASGTTTLANGTALTFDGTSLTFGSTAQRITGDMSNATQSSRLAFQTSTVNGNTAIQAIPNGTAQAAAFNVFNNSDPNNGSFFQFQATATEAKLNAFYTGTGTALPITLSTNGSERVRVDTSGNVGIGTASPGVNGLDVQRSSGTVAIRAVQNDTGAGTFAQITAVKVSGASVEMIVDQSSAYVGTTGSFPLLFRTNSSERMRIDSSGNVGIGTAPSYTLDVYRSGTNTSVIVARNDNSVATLYSTSSFSFAGTSTNTPFGFITNNTERMRFLAGGGITSEDRADAVGYKGIPLNEQSAAYTLVIGDMGKSIVHPASDNNARTFTIPANSSVAFPVGTTISFINMANILTIAITTDTMYLAGVGSTGSRTLAAYGMATAIKLTATTWIISGNGLT